MFKHILPIIITILSACSGGGSDSGNGGNGSTAVNNAPTLENQPTINVLEGQTAVMDIVTNDPDGDLVTLSLKGADSNLFSLSGYILSFVTSPDFEAPGSNAGTNIYSITIHATDGESTATQAITVTVTDAAEGRVVDGPLSGASVFIDSDGDLTLGSEDLTALTDKTGFFKVPTISGSSELNLKVISIGGTDTSTGRQLLGMALMSDLPNSPANAIMVTPVSTIIAAANTPADKQAVLTSLGITGTIEDLLTKDVWALAENSDAEAINIQRANLAIGTILQSATSLIRRSTPGSEANAINIMSAISAQLVTQSVAGADLFDETVLTKVLKQGIEDYAVLNEPGLSIDSDVFAVVASSMATIIAVMKRTENPTSNTAGEIAALVQEDFQEAIMAVAASGDTNAFSASSAMTTLFSGASPEVLSAVFIDTDGDGIIDDEDNDIDNDGFLNNVDRFPFDLTEQIDTDNDGVGNNADSDDDNDGVIDDRDPAPLDYLLTPPTAVIETDTASGNAPLRVSFNANSSIAGNPDDSSDIISSITWNSGDGSTGSGSVFENIFLSAGEYTVSATVTNSDGYSHTATYPLTVSALQGTLSITGSISIPSSYVADSDVNDTETIASSNDTTSSAQVISRSAVVSGYLNQPGSGEDGLSKTNGDIYDYYKINALGGEVINLISGDTESGDIDLYISNSSSTYSDYSIGASTLYESITLPEGPDTYFIEVSAWSGASTYILEVGGRQSLASHGWNASAELVVGELMVKENPSYAVNAIIQSQQSLGVSKAAQSRPSGYKGPVLYKLNALPAQTAASKEQQSGLKSSTPCASDLKLQTLRMAKKMRALEQFKQVEPNFIYKSSAVPNDPFYERQRWHYEQINMPNAWNRSTGMGNVKVAILDTGILLNHPDLENQITADGYDFVSSTDNSGDGDGVDADASDPGDGFDNSLCPNAESQNSSFHGTHVAGTVGASGNNSFGVTGVNWDVDIMPIRVLGCYGGTDLDVQNGILYAAGLPNAWGIFPDSPADIINLSLGSPYSSYFQEEAIAAAREAGVIVIAAAGNSALEGNPLNYPASYPGVISVGATNPDGQRAGYSQYNSSIDIVAPGGYSWRNPKVTPLGQVFSTWGSIEYGASFEAMPGTSMAAPHAAGVASLMKGIHPNLTPDNLDAILAAGHITLDIGEPGKDDQYGYGLLEANKALQTAEAMASGVTIEFPPILQLTSYQVDLGATGTEATIQALNAGGGSLSITQVAVSADNISVAAPVDSNGLGEYLIAVDRTGLAAGSYRENIQFTSDADIRTLWITYDEFPNVEANPDGGRLYTLLYNINTEQVEKQASSDASSGKYSFSIEGIKPGVYTLLTGSDIDNDRYICGPGEACASWPSMAEPDYLIVNKSITDLTMGIRYQTQIEVGPNTLSASSVSTKKIPTQSTCESELGQSKPTQISLSSCAKKLLRRPNQKPLDSETLKLNK